ncbi:MAG: hypothetical protein HY795_07010 [Desulfovibrio sp.]|nr:hypothetical protein [Desulfovibrio sp.]MBI4960710.1 hypothetical protein [Desulfovibrio sp.]
MGESSEHDLDFSVPPRILFEARPDAPARLNVVLPHVDARGAFGGISTAVELARLLADGYASVRMISQMPLPESGRMFAPIKSGEDGQYEVVSLAGGELVCHGREIFLCTHWSTVGTWRAYDEAMESIGLRAPDFYYLIQDFEPDFLPEGEKRLRAQASYGHGERCTAVINSLELARHFSRSGYRFARTHAFAPSLNPDLRAFLDERRWRLAKPEPAPLVVLVYGRPLSPRNRFQTTVQGLALFIGAIPESERNRYAFFSVGQPHQDIMLTPGAVLKSLGKLPLTSYAALLEQSHVGLSLMASPHPSYPPLEMALFGLKTVTNRYASKDLSQSHPGIVSIHELEPQAVASGVAEACRRVREESGPELAVLPSSLSTLTWRQNLRGLGLEIIGSSGQYAGGLL